VEGLIEPAETVHWGGMFSLADQLQMLSLSRKSGVLEVRQDGQIGRVYLADGQVIDAAYGFRSGTQALLTLLRLPRTDAIFTNGKPDAKRTILEPLPSLLLEAARQSDEGTPPSPPNAKGPTLLIATADNTARLHPLNKALVTVGRSLDNDIVISDTSVSRYHARVDVCDFAIILRDLSSRNGTWLRSCRVYDVILEPDDTVYFGLTSARLVHRDWTALSTPEEIEAADANRKPTHSLERNGQKPAPGTGAPTDALWDRASIPFETQIVPALKLEHR
jgi:hypothetical protein